jgi:hypothetical protein
MPNELVIKNGFISQGNSQVSGTLNANFFVGDGSGLTGITASGGPDTYTTGGTLSDTQIIFTRNDSATYSVDLSNLGKKYNKILFVDVTYGNNTLAESNNIYRPFLTIASALTTAVSGDLIVLNPGTYNESITLKDGVDFYAYPDVVLTNVNANSGTITDNGVSVTCSIFGYMSINVNNTTINAASCISLTGATTNVNFQFLDLILTTTISSNSQNAIISNTGGTVVIEARNISCTGTTNNNGISVQPSSTSNRHFITCDSLIGQQYAVNCRNEARLVLNVKYDIKTTGSTGTFAGVIANHTLTGTDARLEINCRNIINETTTSYTCLFSTGTIRGNLYINCDTIQSLNTTLNSPSVGPYAAVLTYFRGAGEGTNWYINCKNILADGGLCIQGSNGFSSEVVINANYIYSRQNMPIRWACIAKLKIYNATIERGSGADNTRIVTMGNTGFGSFTNAQTDSIPVLFENCIFKKTGLVTDVSTNSLIALDGANSTTIVRDCRVVGTNMTASVVAFYADTVAEGNIYFTNTYSQRDNTNITDISQVSGFVYDTNLIVI